MLNYLNLASFGAIFIYYKTNLIFPLQGVAKMFRKILLTTLMALIVNGCATTDTSTVTNFTTPTSISNDSLNQETGILVGTYTKNTGEAEYDTRALSFTDTKSYDSRYKIARKKPNPLIGYQGHRYTLEDNGKEGNAFAFVLPAGEYTFYNFGLSSSNSKSSESWYSDKPFSIPFVVEPNKVNYIGEINFNAIIGTKKNESILLGTLGSSPDKRGGYWIVSDELDRDREFIEKEFQNLSLNGVNNAIPQTKKRFTPFIILPSEEEAFQAQLKAAKEKSVEDDVFGKRINPVWMTCNKPYKLKQDCSLWKATNRNILIDGNTVSVSGSENGDTVLVTIRPNLWTGQSKKSYDFFDLFTKDRLIHSSYYTIKKIFNDAGINIKETRLLKEVAGLSGYGMVLDNDGYSLLKELTIEKQDQENKD